MSRSQQARRLSKLRAQPASRAGVYQVAFRASSVIRFVRSANLLYHTAAMAEQATSPGDEDVSTRPARRLASLPARILNTLAGPSTADHSPQAGAAKNHAWLDRIGVVAIGCYILLLPLVSHRLLGEPAAGGILPLYVTPALYVSDAALALAVIVKLMASGRSRMHFPHLGLPLLVLFGWGLLVAFGAEQRGFAYYTVLRWGVAALAFWIFSTGPLRSATAVRLLGGSLALHVLIGLGQVLTRGPLGLPAEVAIQADRWGAAVVETGGRPFLRAYGLTFHPNVLGGYLAVAILVALPSTRSWSGRMLWWLLAGGVVLTFSRSAWLALLLTMPLAALWLVRRRPDLRRGLAIAFAGLGLMVAVMAGLLARPLATRFSPMLWETERVSLNTRATMVQAALSAIMEQPLSGVGPGNFPLWLQRNRPAQIPQPVHNVTLLLGAEAGLVAALLACALFLFPIGLLVSRWPDLSSWSVLFLLATCALGVVGLLDSYPWSLEGGRGLMALTLGLAANALQRDRLDSSAEPSTKEHVQAGHA